MSSSYVESSEDRERQKRRSELGIFLRRRREQLTPQDVGLPPTGRRHVKGLRREEVALLAGIGTSWYTLLEQGRVEAVSEKTLIGIAEALKLSAAEIEHAFALARSFRNPRERTIVPTSLIQLVERVDFGPSFLMTAHYDLVSWNHVADELFHFSKIPGARRNLLESMMLDPAMHSIFPEWESTVKNMIGLFRANYGRMSDGKFDELIDHLRSISPLFSRLWDDGVVEAEPETICIVKHPGVGTVKMHLMAFVPLANPDYLMMHFSPVLSSAD